jgi:membrane protein
LAIAGSTLVFCWLFGSLSGHDISFRAVAPGAILAAVGFEILKLLGGFYLSLVSNSVSAGVFGSVVGILLFIYLASRYLLFCVAWTATLPRFARLGLGPAGAESIESHLAPGTPSTVPVPPPSAPSPAVVAAGLVATVALAAVLTRPVIRRWWNGATRRESEVERV